MSDFVFGNRRNFMLLRMLALKLQDVQLEHLGTCSRIEITKHVTTVVDRCSKP